MKMKRLLTLATLLIIYGSSIQAKDYTVSSPNGKLSVTVDNSMQMKVYHQGKQIFTVSSRLVSPEGTGSFPRGNSIKIAKSGKMRVKL